MALIFSATILLTAWFGGPGTLPHPEVMKKVSYGILATTLVGVLFLVAIRLTGGVVATLLEDAFGVVSTGLGRAVGDKIRAFRAGLDTLRSFSDFGIASSLSLCMWMLITLAYFEIITAFVASPELKDLTLAKCMLLMARSEERRVGKGVDLGGRR